MAALASFSPHLILRRLILTRPTHAALVSQAKNPFLPLPKTPCFTPTRFISFSPVSSQQLANDAAVLGSVETQSQGEINFASVETESQGESNAALLDSVETESEGESSNAVSEGLKKSNLGAIKVPPPPSLSVKEKKELASYAHSLGKKLKSQQVGKSGVTDFVITALIETLEANELLKLKIHSSCPEELDDAVKKLEESTGSVVVGRIGRTVILYKPSLALQLKAEEKKKRAEIINSKRQSVLQQSPQRRSAGSESGQEARQYPRGRQGGRRGSSRS